MLFGKKFIRGLLTKLSRRQSTIVSIEELCELVKDRRSLDETIVRLSKENEILRERVSALQSILESHKKESFDKIGNEFVCKKYGVVIPASNYYEDNDYVTYHPSVIYNGSIFKMWYTGSDRYRSRIYYATSIDGISWKKHGIVLDIDNIGVSEDRFLYYPNVIFDGSKYHMWYIVSDNINKKLHYATSIDGVNWTKHGVVTSIVKSDRHGNYHDISTSVIYDGTTYKMWYHSYYRGRYRIFYATSRNAIDWYNHGIVLDLGNDGESDSFCAYEPSVIYDGSIYHMIYVGGDGNTTILHYATSKNGVSWEKHGIASLLTNNKIFDASSIIYYNDKYSIWYASSITGRRLIHYAELSKLK